MRNPFTRKRYGQVYDGPVVFAADGSHYPVKHNRDGSDAGPDYAHRLLWNSEQGAYLYARLGEPTHLSLYHAQHVDLAPGSED